MAKIDFAGLVKSIGKGLKDHSPEILVGVGIVGMIGTIVMAVRATPKAMEQLKEAEEQKKAALSPQETVKTAWKNYVPAAVTGTLSAACIIGANSIHLRQKAAVSAACALAEASLADFKSKAIERLGEKKVREIADDVAKDQVKENPMSKSQVVVSSKGGTWFFDPWTHTYFQEDIEKIRRAEYLLNKDLISQGYVSLNDFYYAIDRPSTKVGNDIGWNIVNGSVELWFSSQLNEYDEPCVVIGFHKEPHYDFESR